MLQFDAVLARSASALTMAAFPVFPNLIARLSRQIQRRSAWAYIPKQRAGLGAAACIAAAFSASVGAQIPGSLDTSFGASGVRITSLSGADVVNGLALQPDGKIVLAGYCVVSSQEDFCVARYTTSGNLDPSFNGPGANGVGVGTGAGRFTFPLARPMIGPTRLRLMLRGASYWQGNASAAALALFVLRGSMPTAALIPVLTALARTASARVAATDVS